MNTTPTLKPTLTQVYIDYENIMISLTELYNLQIENTHVNYYGYIKYIGRWLHLTVDQVDEHFKEAAQKGWIVFYHFERKG